MELPLKKYNLLISTGTLGAICLAIILGMLFVGLWPLNYIPKNQVTWVEAGNGISFKGRGHAFSTESTTWPREDYSGGPITLEIVLKPERTYFRGIPHILSLCDRSGREVVYFGQWKNHLIVRLMEDSRWVERVKREIESGDVLIPGKPVHITLVLVKDRAVLFTEGKLVKEFIGFDLTQLMAERSVQSVVFGNSSTGDSPWRGKILSFSVFDKALDSTTIRDRYQKWESGAAINTDDEIIRYRFHKNSERTIRNYVGKDWDLIIPESLIPLRREFLSLPPRQFLKKKSFFKDALINLVGFTPLGFFLAVFFGTSANSKRLRTLAISVLLGGLLSLFIEVNQVFLISRSSSVADLIMNTFGTAVGVSFMILYSHFQDLPHD